MKSTEARRAVTRGVVEMLTYDYHGVDVGEEMGGRIQFEIISPITGAELCLEYQRSSNQICIEEAGKLGRGFSDDRIALNAEANRLEEEIEGKVSEIVAMVMAAS